MNYIPVQELAAKGPVSLIIRHAERFAIENMANALDMRLTEKGHADARQLGRDLVGLCPVTLYHSPVPRCQETAQGILEGLIEAGGKGHISGHLMELGGPYVLGDWMELVEETRKHGNDPFVRKWFDGELMEGLMMPLREAARLTAAILVHQLEGNSTSFINVTHDWNVMILREYYFGLKHEDSGLPDYLDGMAAYIEKDLLHLLYHERKVSLHLPLV